MVMISPPDPQLAAGAPAAPGPEVPEEPVQPEVAAVPAPLEEAPTEEGAAVEGSARSSDLDAVPASIAAADDTLPAQPTPAGEGANLAGPDEAGLREGASVPSAPDLRARFGGLPSFEEALVEFFMEVDPPSFTWNDWQTLVKRLVPAYPEWAQYKGDTKKVTELRDSVFTTLKVDFI